MYRIFSAAVVALGIAAAASAQDTTTQSKTKVSADGDARTITLTGCLERGPGSLFTLRSSGAVASDDVTTKSKTKTEVDRDETRTKSRTDIEHGDHRETTGLAATYQLTPQQGVDLAGHVGRRVQIIAVALKPGKDDADVKIKDQTKIERKNAPDAEQKSETERTISRRDGVTVVSVKPIGGACAH